MQYYFGKEKVTLQGQSFCSFKLNYFISLCIFGKDFCKLQDLEIVYQSKRVTIIHICSIERAQELLTIDGLSAATFEEDNYLYHASARVSVVINAREQAGFVLSSNGNEIEIQLTDNSSTLCAPSQWIKT